ncbi:beta-propeller domain-containing protein [[Eubacterium] cellulosolvens]
MDKKLFYKTLPVLTILAVIVFSNMLTAETRTDYSDNDFQIKTFISKQELENFILLKIKEAESNNQYWRFIETARNKESVQPLSAPDGLEYSTTNIQVEGVDEADIIKIDGQYAYVSSENKLHILRVYPAEKMALLSSIVLDGRILGLFVNDDRMIVFESSVSPIKSISDLSRREVIPPLNPQGVNLQIYDISKRKSPILSKELFLEGYYMNSRMIGDWVYVVVNQPAIYWIEDYQEVILPRIYVDDKIIKLPASEIHYSSESSDMPESYSIIVALNIEFEDVEIEYKVLLTGYATNMYVSQKTLYITMPHGDWWQDKETTIIHGVAIQGPDITFEASGIVPGRVLNQFSMDEHKGYFRIATTNGQVMRGRETSSNNVYVLNKDLKIVGLLENLAPGEQIHSARFMGDRCYLVTFKKVDPLFTIDMSHPENPRILGKLKIPGYSDYLHPYDENHIIGIGKETVEAEEGDFAWYQGLKISLFDVSDVKNPREVDKLIIGDRGTDSPALRDHHSILFDRNRNLLVIPILEAKIFVQKHQEDLQPSTHGDFVFQGVYVINIDPNIGFTTNGKITHLNDFEELLKSGYYFDSEYEIKRSFYIENVLYTVSNKMIKSNDLINLTKISELQLAN